MSLRTILDSARRDRDRRRRGQSILELAESLENLAKVGLLDPEKHLRAAFKAAWDDDNGSVFEIAARHMPLRANDVRALVLAVVAGENPKDFWSHVRRDAEHAVCRTFVLLYMCMRREKEWKSLRASPGEC